MNLAPIVLFVYNRPQHTLKTLEALMQNELAEKSELFIYCDGPKPNAKKEDLDKIDAVHTIILKKQWCKKVHIIKAEVNKGLANSIVAGVTEIVNRYGKIIVLEDDIVTSKGFLRYMNEALNLYENEPKIMHIGSYLPYTNSHKKLPETFLSRFMSCWGWATWKDRWDYYEKNPKSLINEFNSEMVKKFDLNESGIFWRQIIANATQEKDYNRRNIYDPTITGDTEYGYRGDARGQGGTRADGGEKVPFFNALLKTPLTKLSIFKASNELIESKFSRVLDVKL